MKVHCMRYMLYIGMSCGTPCSAALSIGVVSAKGSKGEDIPKLIEPILKGEADIVIGDRQTEKVQHFSPVKKKLQKLGSWVPRGLSETNNTGCHHQRSCVI